MLDLIWKNLKMILSTHQVNLSKQKPYPETAGKFQIPLIKSKVLALVFAFILPGTGLMFYRKLEKRVYEYQCFSYCISCRLSKQFNWEQ